MTFACDFTCPNSTCASPPDFERWKSEFFCGALLKFVPCNITGAASIGAFGACGTLWGCWKFTGAALGVGAGVDTAEGFGMFAKEEGFEASVLIVAPACAVDQPLSAASFFCGLGASEMVSIVTGAGLPFWSLDVVRTTGADPSFEMGL